MALSIAHSNYTKLEIDGTELKAYGNDEIVSYSLEGITTLNCSSNRLKSLPELPDSILALYCQENLLEELPNLPSALKHLRCHDNRLKTLPELPDSLSELCCRNNLLKKLPKIPSELKTLDCSRNRLERLPEIPEALISLSCWNNRLSVLPKRPKSLITFICWGNPLVFISPSSFTSAEYHSIPDHIRYLFFEPNHPTYQKRYEVYVYLVSFLILETKLLHSVISNDNWWLFVTD